MKYILLLLVLQSCYGHKAEYRTTPADTLFTVRTFIAFPGKQIKFDAVYRVTKDTVNYIDKDSTTKVKALTRDTTYYIPIKPTDTSKVQYAQAPKGSVYEGDDLKKGVQMLEQWIKQHEQLWTTKK